MTTPKWDNFISDFEDLLDNKVISEQEAIDLFKTTMNRRLAKNPAYSFIARIGKEVLKPKGFYYQGKHIILVGDAEKGHTIRRKELISEVHLTLI